MGELYGHFFDAEQRKPRPYKQCAKDSSNTTAAFSTIGASNHSTGERAENDFYATEPKATRILLKQEKFSPLIWECACGAGHISKELEAAGYTVLSTDLIYRGFGEQEPFDFLKDKLTDFDGDIVTNPPYKFAKEFVEAALETVKGERKVAMFLKLTFLESKSSRKLFAKHPPKTIYVSSSRLSCLKNGLPNVRRADNAIVYAWFVWEKGFEGDTVIKWVN